MILDIRDERVIWEKSNVKDSADIDDLIDLYETIRDKYGVNTVEEVYNQAIDDYKASMVDIMDRLWKQYVADKINVPKPDFFSAVALAETLSSKLKEKNIE